MVHRLILLILSSLMWFVFGTLRLVRSNKDFNEFKKSTGQVEKIWIDVTKKLKGGSVDVLLFKINGTDEILGIYHNTKADYQQYIEKIHLSDIVTVYYDENGRRTFEGYNFHVYQLEKDGQILLDKEKLNMTDKKVGLILYGVGLLFSIAPIWFYKKIQKKNSH